MVFSGDWDFFNKWQKEGGKGKCLVLVNAEEKENEAEEENFIKKGGKSKWQENDLKRVLHLQKG